MAVPNVLAGAVTGMIVLMQPTVFSQPVLETYTVALWAAPLVGVTIKRTGFSG